MQQAECFPTHPSTLTIFLVTTLSSLSDILTEVGSWSAVPHHILLQLPLLIDVLDVLMVPSL